MRQALDWSEVAYVLGAGRARAGDSGGGGGLGIFLVGRYNGTSDTEHVVRV